MKEYKKHYQVGFVIKIRLEPRMAKRFGFLVDTEHEIQQPPKGKLSTAMSVWIKDKTGINREIKFPYWIWTGKTNKIKRIRKN